MKLASIETVVSVKPHPNADKLDLATIQGWQVIVKRGEYNAGDRVVFIATDTILPNVEWSAFLADKKNPEKPIRLNTIKLRGEYSSGLVLPLSVLPENMREWQVGVDVGSALGVKKYEKELPKALGGTAKCGFPMHLACKTDEDNGLSWVELATEVLKLDFIVTQKLDGSSMTVVVNNGVIEHVCSRNLSLMEHEGNAFWHAAMKLNLEGFTGIIQGELMGPGIQGNQLALLEPEIYIFQIKQGGRYLHYDEMCNAAKILGAKVVREYFRVQHREDSLPFKLDSLQEFADGTYIVQESTQNTVPCEGIVIRALDYRPCGRGRPLGFKLINRNYKDQ